MPAYRFEALDAAGKAASGLLEADNAKAARAQLRARALVPLAVTPVTAATTDGSAPRFTRRVFSATGRAVWTRQLAGLVGSGLPLERALTALADESENDRQRELVAHLKSEVNAGSSFARALGTAPREFDEVYRAVVAAGEQSGALGPVLERLADDQEQQQALRTKVLGAMLYPAIVSLVAMIIVVVLVTWVVPQIANTFTSSKRTYSYGAHAAHVSVDARTGHVELVDYVAVEDVGRIINPHTLHGQAMGAVVQGLGGVFLEHLVYDDQGQLLTGSLADYLMPVADSFPCIRAFALENHPSPHNPLGAKGAGEGGIIPVAGVVANAVSAALSTLGVGPRELPLSPSKLWHMIDAARQRTAA